MAIEKVSRLLRIADEKNTTIIAFECSDYNMVYALAAAAEELSKPVIAMLDPITCTRDNVSNPASFAGEFFGVASQFSVPIALHLDHCSDHDYIFSAISNGFPSVMYDGSMLTLEENVENTRRIVLAAPDVDVEAELGRVGFANDSDEDRLDMYTKPEVAAHFVQETRVASLAVAIGSAHGVYKQTPRLDLERLSAINDATDVPLVLHGGSGIPEDQLKVAFTRGINKFNVGTEYFQLYYAAVEEFCKKYHISGSPLKEPLHILEMPSFVQKRLMEYLRKKLLLCTL